MKKLFLILALLTFMHPVFSQNTEPIKDELLDPSMYGESSVFKLWIYKHGKYHYIPIEDELVDKDFISKASDFAVVKKENPDDLFFEKFIDPSKVRKILPKVKYDFTKQQIPIHIQLAKKLKTKGLLEGTVIPFIATHDFEIKGKKFEKGTEVLGRVETLSASDKMGVPETLIIDNFYIKDSTRVIWCIQGTYLRVSDLSV